MRKVLTLALILSFFSCNSQSENKESLIVNSKWECQIAEGCTNVYEFKPNNEFSFFSCEMEDEYYGKYYFVGDTLIIEQQGSIYDKELPKESIHRAEKKLYKVDIKGKELTHISISNWVNEKWVKSDFKFDPSYRYNRIK